MIVSYLLLVYSYFIGNHMSHLPECQAVRKIFALS